MDIALFCTHSNFCVHYIGIIECRVILNGCMLSVFSRIGQDLINFGFVPFNRFLWWSMVHLPTCSLNNLVQPPSDQLQVGLSSLLLVRIYSRWSLLVADVSCFMKLRNSLQSPFVSFGPDVRDWKQESGAGIDCIRLVITLFQNLSVYLQCIVVVVEVFI